MPNNYVVIKSDPGSMLFEGQTVVPYYEDGKEIIIQGFKADVHHHVRKNGEYFAEHFKLAGGK